MIFVVSLIYIFWTQNKLDKTQATRSPPKTISKIIPKTPEPQPIIVNPSARLNELFSSKNYEKSHQFVIDHLKNNPKSPYKKYLQDQIPTILTAIGWQHIHTKNCAKAVPHFEKAIAYNNHSEALKGYLFCQSKLKNLENLASICLQSVQKNIRTDILNFCHNHLIENRKFLLASNLLENVSKDHPQLLGEILKLKSKSAFAQLYHEDAQQIESSYFRFFIPKKISSHADNIRYYFEDNLTWLINNYPFELPSSKMNVYVYDSKNMMSESHHIPDWIGGFFDGNIKIFYDPNRDDQNLKRLILHELTHAFIDQKIQGYQIETWLNEGIAQYLECHKYQCLNQKNQGRRINFLSKSKIKGNFLHLKTPEIKSAYQNSLFLLKLINRQNPNGVYQIIQSLNKFDTNTDSILKSVEFNFDSLYQIAAKNWNQLKN